MIALLTNVFVPCNGRFGTLITMISVFLVGYGGLFGSLLSALVLVFFILFAIAMTFVVCALLSKTLLSGEPSAFTLELPPYRTPDFTRVIVRSTVERTFAVLLRALSVAAPAGLVLWLLANINVGSYSVLYHLSEFFDPLGQLLGMDGAIILAFILALPANEIMLPITMMIYGGGRFLTEYSSVSELFSVLSDNGWTVTTAVCVIIFTLFHFPCGTTLLSVKKETGSYLWTFFSAALPTAVGILLCLCVSFLSKTLQGIAFG